jgi:multidrug efflux pump subunit AcrA (membrane-fusion protein)
MTRRLVTNGGLVVALVAAGGVGAMSLQANATTVKATPRTSAVQRGTVQSTTAATGNVQAASALAVGFSTTGKVAQVLVKTGDIVAPGQTMATLDTAAADAAVAQATTDLATATKKLAALQASKAATTTTTANAGAAQAAAKSYADAVTQAATADASAQRKVDDATGPRDAAKGKLEADQAAGASAQQLADDQAVLERTQAVLDGVVAAAQQTKVDGQKKVTAAADTLDKAVASVSSAPGATTVTDDQIDTATSAVTQATSKLADANAVRTACTLVAPAAGTVTALNAVVGQQVSASGVSVPSTSTTTSGSGGSSGILTLTDLSALQVKTSVAEADVAKLKVGQIAKVTFDALPDVTLAGKVLTVATTSTVSNNVVSFETLVSLVNPPSTVRSGMSAAATIVTASRDDVLRVPTAAVRGTGANGTVTVLKDGVQIPTPVVLGMRGDDATEVISGLAAGDLVVTSSGTGAAGTTATTAARSATGQQRQATVTAGGGPPAGGVFVGPGGP